MAKNKIKWRFRYYGESKKKIKFSTIDEIILTDIRGKDTVISESYSGDIVSFSADSIVFKPYWYYKHESYNSSRYDSDSDSSITINKNFSDTENNLISINKEDIDHIGRDPIMGFVGSGIAGISMFTLIIVAPLVSVRYIHGGFNSDRYLLWAKYSLIGVAVGYPANIFFQTREYRFFPKK
jgi:hypothetical protein